MSSLWVEVSHSQAAQYVNRLGNTGHTPAVDPGLKATQSAQAVSAIVHIPRAGISNPLENNKD